MHAVLVLLTVPLVYGGMIAVWSRLRRHAAWRGVARYTLATAVVGILFGLGMTPFVQGPYAGLLERISVAIMVQWYAVMGIVVMRETRRREAGGRVGVAAESTPTARA
jgi:membrane associated rhomboid family serine protease